MFLCVRYFSSPAWGVSLADPKKSDMYAGYTGYRAENIDLQVLKYIHCYLSCNV